MKNRIIKSSLYREMRYYLSLRGLGNYLYHNQRWPFWLAKPIANWRLNRDLAKFPLGSFMLDCNYHPCIIINHVKYPYDGDLGLFDLVGRHESCCSLYNCGPELISKQVAFEAIKIWEKDGDRGLAKKYGGWDDKSYDQFERIWRNPIDPPTF